MCLIGQAVLELLIKTIFCMFWSKNSKTALPTKNLMPFLSFSDNLLGDAYIPFKKVLIILRLSTKHAQFWFGAQFPLKSLSWRKQFGNYSLIAFDERVTFWFQRVRSLPCATVRVRMLHYLRVGLRITITQSHTHSMQQTRTHKAVTRRVEAKNLLSRRRQSEYSKLFVSYVSESLWYK